MLIKHALKYRAGGAPVYDAAAVTYFAAMTTQPDATRKGILNDMIVGMKADGVWALLDAWWFMAAHDIAGQALTINGKNPATFTLVPVNSPTFTQNRGGAGDGVSSYYNTQFTPSTAGGNWVQDGASFGAYVNGGTNAQAVTAMMGVLAPNAIGASVLPWRAGDTITAQINLGGATSGVGTTTTRLGWTSIGRYDVNTMNAYKNAGKLAGAVTGSSGLPSGPLWLGGRNNNGAMDLPSDNRLGFAFVGGALSDAQHLALYNRVNTALTAIGAN